MVPKSLPMYSFIIALLDVIVIAAILAEVLVPSVT